MTGFASLFETYKTAVFKKDLTLFTSLYSENLRVFDMWQQWSYDGLELWERMVKSWFSTLGENHDVVNFSDIKVEEGADLAYASAIVRFTAVSAEGSELRYLENRFTWVGKKQGTEWKIIHQHTSGPIDFQTMKVILKK